MNKILLSTISFILGALIIGVLIAKEYRHDEDENVSASTDTIFVNTNFSPTSVQVSSTRQQLLAEKGNRRFAEICNTNKASSSDRTSGLYLLLSSASSSVSTSTGRPIWGGECYTIGELFSYPGEVWGLMDTATANRISVQEN